MGRVRGSFSGTCLLAGNVIIPKWHRPRTRLRRNSTGAEKKLWERLRDRQVAGAKFRRQFPIGPYVVDFFAIEQQLIIEVDGGQHAVAKSDEARSR
jgi:very-short-patch-repair endonuclease